MMRLCVWLINRFVDADIRSEIIGDLTEQPHLAGARLFRETLSALWNLRATRQPGDGLVTHFLGDLRLAARLLRRSPVYAVASVLTLGLAIGATTAIFAIVEPVLLRPLPYPTPDRLIYVWERDRDGSRSNLGFATIKDLISSSKTIEAAAAIGDWQPTLSSHGEPERVSGDRVSWTYFRVLGSHPELGRDFVAEEDAPGKNQVVILSHGLWRRRYGGDPGIIGQSITIGGNPLTVVGVMPASFDNVANPASEIWRPLGYLNQPFACRTCHHLQMLVRLRAGASVTAARAELEGLHHQLKAEYANEYESVGLKIVPMQAQVTTNSRPVLLALSGAALLLLLIAIANAVNLQLARALRREEEFSIRVALGAARSRVLSQLVTESLLLAALGGLAGFILAAIALPLLVRSLPPNLPRISAIHLDAGAIAVVAVVVVSIAVALGLIPARRESDDLASSLRSSRRTAGSSRHLARAGLVAAEIALAMTLLIGGTLMAKSLIRLLAVDPGFDPAHLVSLEFNAVGARYAQDAAVYAYHQRVREAVAAVPGVLSVASSNQLPLAGSMDAYGVVDPENPPTSPERMQSGDRYVVSADYLKAMRIPILRGRGFTLADMADTSNRIALVSVSLAGKLWPGQNALGKHIRMGGDTRPAWTVVGVTGDVHHQALDAADQQWYVPEGLWFGGADNQESLIVRTQGDAAAMAATVRKVVAAVDPTQPVIKVATMDQLIASSTSQRRLAMILFGAFASAALLLAIAGIYGVLAGSVAERTREIGVRSALGATPGDIVRLVVGQGSRLAAIGIMGGLLGALVLSRFLQSLLFDVEPNDPATLAGVSLVLGGVAMVACLIPATRAARVDPSRALRSD